MLADSHHLVCPELDENGKFRLLGDIRGDPNVNYVPARKYTICDNLNPLLVWQKKAILFDGAITPSDALTLHFIQLKQAASLNSSPTEPKWTKN